MQKELFEAVSDSEDHDDSVEAPGHDHGVTRTPGLIDPADQGTFDALAAELNSSKEQNKKLEQKLVTTHAKILQLENNEATGKYFMLSKIVVYDNFLPYLHWMRRLVSCHLNF